MSSSILFDGCVLGTSDQFVTTGRTSINLRAGENITLTKVSNSDDVVMSAADPIDEVTINNLGAGEVLVTPSGTQSTFGVKSIVGGSYLVASSTADEVTLDVIPATVTNAFDLGQTLADDSDPPNYVIKRVKDGAGITVTGDQTSITVSNDFGDFEPPGVGVPAGGQPGPPYQGDFLQYDDLKAAWVNQPGRWDDLRVPMNATTRGGSADPTFTKVMDNGAGSQGIFLYYFINTREEELYFVAQMPHSYAEGTDIEPHVHFIQANAATGNVRWGLEYAWSNVNDDFPTNSSIILSDTIALVPAGPLRRHRVAGMPAISGAGKQISSMLMCRIFRDISVAGNFPASIGLLEVDFHYQQEGVGSTQEFIK